MPSGSDWSFDYITPPLSSLLDLSFTLQNHQTKDGNEPASPYPDEFATKKRFVGQHNRLMGGKLLSLHVSHSFNFVLLINVFFSFRYYVAPDTSSIGTVSTHVYLDAFV